MASRRNGLVWLLGPPVIWEESTAPQRRQVRGLGASMGPPQRGQREFMLYPGVLIAHSGPYLAGREFNDLRR